MPDNDGEKVDAKNEDEDEKTWKNEFAFWILHIKIRLYGICHENLRKKKFDPFLKTFLINRGKNENEIEKIWKIESNFWILYIKIRFYGDFHENQKKKKFDRFFKTFLTNRGKMKMKMKKFGIINSIFQFSTSKLGYLAIFMKILEKLFWLILMTFLTLLKNF